MLGQMDTEKTAHNNTMNIITNAEYGGERPLYRSEGLRIEGVTIHAGESALKECRDVEALHCRFEGKYPLWETQRFSVEHCLFTEGARAAIWYSRGLQMRHCQVDAPKMFREMDDMTVEDTLFTNAQETLWMCRGVTLRRVRMEQADYLLMHSAHIRISDYEHRGNYAFQYCRDMEIRGAVIHSKDAFWNTQDVTVYDSVILGEYLGWYSKRLRLVRCRIGETQPLCYCDDLTLEDCTLDADADLAFEYSTLQATIHGHVTSVKNPTSGFIRADSIGQIILDPNQKAPADCRIDITNPS